ncbi:MAG: hypothetical protein JWR75_2113 [Devosia sp.]|nr:hypothetical protein [Devosia sp.]
MRRTLGAIGGIALGLVLSQFPEYAQQYTQRLGGAVDELKIITEDFDRAANAGGLSREEALARYDLSLDEFLANRGASMQATFVRYSMLTDTLTEIQNASAVERLQHLPDYLDSDIGRRTLENFQPAVPVTIEGFAYAGAGLLIGYAVSMGIINFLMLPFRRRRVVYRP